MVHDPDVAEARQVHVAMAQRMTLRLHADGLWDDVPRLEQRLLARRPGTWAAQEAMDAAWSGEVLAVLLWALSADRMPEFDTRADTDAQIRVMQPADGAPQPTTSYALRPREEIETMNEAAQAWLARANTRLIVDLKMDVPPGIDLDKLVAKAAQTAHKTGLAGKPLQRDFPALGKPYRDLDEAEFQSVHLIAVHRLRALKWLGTGRDDEADAAVAHVPTRSWPSERTSTANRPAPGR